MKYWKIALLLAVVLLLFLIGGGSGYRYLGGAHSLDVAGVAALHGQNVDLPGTGWPNYGNDAGGHRYSSARQIDASNVAELDDLENEIHMKAVALLGSRQPMADDLRAVIAAFQIASTLERIGDYARNIAKRSSVLSSVPAIIGPVKAIERMSKLVQGMIADVLDAYQTLDIEMADDVRNRDLEVDQLHTSLFREVLTYMMEEPKNITPCTHLLFIAKNIERIGDHATNIAEKIYMIIHGHEPEDDRPKQDRSSTTMIEDVTSITDDGQDNT